MASVAETLNLVDDIVRLRRAERLPEAAPLVAPVRRDLESRLGPTLSRSRASRVLGVSQTALDRWVAAGQIPIVITPTGRREVPRQFVVELSDAVRALKDRGQHRHVLAAALAERREVAERASRVGSSGGRSRDPASRIPRGHRTAERRGLAYHRAIAERLDQPLVDDAQAQLERLESAGHLHPRYAQRWREILALPIDRIAAAITADDQEAVDLRQSSPFAGMLNEQERRRVIRGVR